MRNVKALACLPVLFLATGTIAAGCLSSSAGPPVGDVDSGLPSIDGGVPTGDGALLTDATVNVGDGSVLATAAIDFGLVGCGTGSASRTYSITNPARSPITCSASIPSGSIFAIAGTASGVVLSGATASITLTASGIPTTTTAGKAITSTLTLTTNVEGAATVAVPLKATALGGALTVSPALAGFGQVQIGKNGTTIPLTLSNSGNAPVTVTFGAPQSDGGVDSEFGIFYSGSPGPTTILAGGAAGAGATFLPTGPGGKAVTLAIQSSDPLCSSPATAIAMSGTGTAAAVAVGPDPLQFGAVACGQAGGPLQVTITNSSPGAINFTDSLGLGASSPFTIDVSSGSVPAQSGDAGVAIITVTPKAIPVPGNIAPNAYADTLVVTPSSPFVAPTTITLSESASGAVLSLSMDAGTDFGNVSPNQTPSLPFVVTNTGNVDAPLVVNVTGGGFDAGFASTTPVAAGDGGVATGTATFAPVTGGSASGTIGVSTSAPLCSLPVSLDLTAFAAVPTATFPTTPIGVTTTCNGGGVTQGSVTIQNTGAVPLTIANAASASGTFTVVSAPESIAAGSSGDITIRASAIGQGTAGGSTLSDTLTFVTNEPGGPTRSVPVAVGVNGANLVFGGEVAGNTVSINAPSCAPQGFDVANTGNLSATVVATGTYPNISDTDDSELTDFQFGGAFSSPTVIAPGGQVNDSLSSPLGECQNVSCTLDATQTFTTTDGSDAGTQVGICIPLPTLALEYFYCACNSKGC